MTILNDLSTGVIAGTIGFFGSKSMKANLVTELLMNAGMGAFSVATLRAHPYFKLNQQNYIAIIVGSLIPTGIGVTFKYFLNIPDYLTNPFIVSVDLSIAIIAALAERKRNEYNELNDDQICTDSMQNEAAYTI